jgi:hypothetical protein
LRIQAANNKKSREACGKRKTHLLKEFKQNIIVSELKQNIICSSIATEYHLLKDLSRISFALELKQNIICLKNFKQNINCLRIETAKLKLKSKVEEPGEKHLLQERAEYYLLKNLSRRKVYFRIKIANKSHRNNICLRS